MTEGSGDEGFIIVNKRITVRAGRWKNRPQLTLDTMDSQRLVEELAQNLECPVCFEFPTKPIFTCIVGHLVCARCHGMLNICPLCRGKFHGTRSFIAEASVCTIKKIIQGSSLSSSVPTGRTPSVAGNPIRCCLAVNGCRHKLMDASRYIDHLKNTHGVSAVHCATGRFIHKVMVAPSSKMFVKRGVERLFLLEVAGKPFIINMFQDGNQIQIWAEKEIRAMESVFSKVQLSIPNTGTGIISWAGNINGLHVNEKSVLIAGTCLKVSAWQLKECLQVEPNGSRSWKLEVYIYNPTSGILFGRGLAISQNIRHAFQCKARGSLAVCVNGFKALYVGLSVQPSFISFVVKLFSVFLFVLAIYVTFCVTNKEF